MLALDDGARVQWDDGAEKSFDETLARPDLEDVFALPYRTGPVAPVTTPDDDPGRVRVDEIFRATYGHDAKAVRASLVPLAFFGATLLVHPRAHAAFERVAGRLASLVAKDPTLAPFLHDVGGTFVWRTIAGTARPSAHSYGIALDLNVSLSDYWRSRPPPVVWRNRVPQPIVDAFEAEGFIWGGRWYHYDTMHFEFRPELLDPSCK